MPQFEEKSRRRQNPIPNFFANADISGKRVKAAFGRIDFARLFQGVYGLADFFRIRPDSFAMAPGRRGFPAFFRTSRTLVCMGAPYVKLAFC
jgi:hypothetical protein